VLKVQESDEVGQGNLGSSLSVVSNDGERLLRPKHALGVLPILRFCLSTAT
jgi:hypothetical protein